MNQNNGPMRRLIAAMCLLGLLGSRTGAQTNGVHRTFDVASVKPNGSGSRTRSTDELPGGRFVAVNVSLRDLILTAYMLQEFQLVGGPDWIDKDRFDIQAKAEGDTPWDEMRFMLQALFAERFKLRVHEEWRELPVYDITMARTDGKLDPRLISTNVDCVALRKTALQGARAATAQCDAGITPGIITAHGMTMDGLATVLGPFVGRLVRNRTGLVGTFDFQLRWTPESSARPATDDRPSLFTAVQEQLGLRLEAQKRPVDVIVVDDASTPTVD
jgi:uncharacterized protein (TIGR03435 family)